MKILLFLIISLLLCYSQEGESCFLSKRKHVHVVNGLPPNPQPLHVHCKSRDDDLGEHVLSVNQSFNFNFCIIAFETLFHCDVQWEGKGKNFTAYTTTWPSKHPCMKSNDCTWTVKSDGIYAGGIKEYNWS